MKSPMARAVLIFLVLAAGTVALLVMGVRRQTAVRCEVCVAFHGGRACREAAGKTREEAQRTAHENACAFLASGMTDSVSCQNTAPESVSCEGSGLTD